MKSIRIWWASLKDKFTTKVPILLHAPGVCPSCGAAIEVPLTRTMVNITCYICQEKVYVMAVGIMDINPDRLVFVHNKVTETIREYSERYNLMGNRKKMN